MADADPFDAFEREGWATNDAGAYERLFGPITSHPIDALLDAAHVGPGTRVVDVATGPGFVAARAATRGAVVTGVDRSAQMLALAASRHPEIRFISGDAEQLALPAAGFDAAVASFCILHLARPERCASELARITAPGGRVAVTAWNTPDRARLFGVLLDAARTAGARPPDDLPAGPDFFRFAADVELTALLAGAGLKQIEVHTLDWQAKIASAEELWNGLAQGTVRTRALLVSQPPGVQAAIRAALVEALAPYRSGDGYAVPVSVKLAAATR
jgi:SAM-dependent methyltransferase